jgi:flagellar biosynthesis protein FliR
MRTRTYTAYGIGCAVVWAVLLAVAAAKASNHSMHTILLVFYGWVIGWVSATIARFVYPPPKSRKPVNLAS